MRTKWQSGNYKMCEPLMGNRFFGDDKAGSRESLPDLSRKLYSAHCPIIILKATDKTVIYISLNIKERF